METKDTWQNSQKSIEELHEESKTWVSEIDFVNDEIKFLNHLLSVNYINTLHEGLSKRIEIFTKKMKLENEAGILLLKELANQELILLDLIEKNTISSNIKYLETHKKLEKQISLYLLKYKQLKKQIFEVVEKTMKKKHQKKISN